MRLSDAQYFVVEERPSRGGGIAMTSKHAVVITWNRPVAGREAQSVELFNQFTNYLTRQQRDKQIDDFEPLIFEAYPGNITGMVIVRGGADKLFNLRGTDEWHDFVAQGVYMLRDFGVLDASLGEALQDRLRRYSRVASKA